MIDRRSFMKHSPSSLTGLAAALHILPTNEATAKDCDDASEVPVPDISASWKRIEEIVEIMRGHGVKYQLTIRFAADIREPLLRDNSMWPPSHKLRYVGLGADLPYPGDLVCTIHGFVFQSSEYVGRPLYCQQHTYFLTKYNMLYVFEGQWVNSVQWPSVSDPTDWRDGLDQEFRFPPTTPKRQKPPLTSLHLDETPNGDANQDRKGEASCEDRRLPQRE